MSEQPPQQDGSPDPSSPDAGSPNPGSPNSGSGDHLPYHDRRWLPRGAFIFFAIVAVLLVDVSTLRPSWIGDDDDSGDNEPPTSTSGTSFNQNLAGLGLPEGVSLGDDNSTSTAFTVPLPRDSRLADTEFRLVGRTQSSGAGTIFMRVLVDGAAQYVGELDEGLHALDLEVPVPDEALIDGSVRIQVRLTGSLDQRRCNFDDRMGALVILDGEKTALHGELDDPVHTVQDTVTTLEHSVTLDLAIPTNGAEARAWFQTAAQLGVALTQEGHSVSFAEVEDEISDADGSRVLVGPADALEALGWKPIGDAEGPIRTGTVGDVTTGAVIEPVADVFGKFIATSPVTTADTGATLPRSLQFDRPRGNRISLERLGADTEPQLLSTTRAWRATYSLADLPGGRVPTALRLAFEVPPTPEDTRWLVETALNGRQLPTQLLQGIRRHRVSVPLPAGSERLRNELRVTLMRDRDVGGCNVRQPTYAVQLLPESTLVLDGSATGFTGVPALYADGFVLDLPTDSTAAPADALAALVPTLAEFSAWQQAPDFAWDRLPGRRPFFSFGPAPADADPAVRLEDGRLVGAGFDLQAFEDGLVVALAATPSGGRGLVLTPAGDPATAIVPPYDDEVARVIATAGGGFVVSPSGRVVSVPPVRTESSP